MLRCLPCSGSGGTLGGFCTRKMMGDFFLFGKMKGREWYGGSWGVSGMEGVGGMVVVGWLAESRISP